MNLMICMRGEPEQLPYLPEIADLSAGIELGSYGLVGVQSEWDWGRRLTLHKALRAQFAGVIAIHGPFIGMEYTHIDHLIRGVVSRRLDLTLEAALELRVSRVVLHSGYKPEIGLFNLHESWLKENIEFWQKEIDRWRAAGIQIVLENDIENSPDLLVRLVDEVDNPYLGLCLDIGHLHRFSALDALEWLRRMGKQLFHIHLHDNDGTNDSHWPIGRGTIDFDSFYDAVIQQVPNATLSLEIVDEMEVMMNDLRRLADYFASR